MFSVVCVFNDAQKLERRLLDSLKKQSVSYDLVTVDNRHGQFSGASTALNWGAARSKGDWVVFVHQDVALLSENWLERAEELLSRHNPAGWVGIAGVSSSGVQRGLLRDSAMLRGEAFDRLLEVQTLDEVLLIHRRQSSGDAYFDEQLTGWHAYGVEACCRAARSGAKNYVMSLPVWHDTERTNLNGLGAAQEYVWRKHGAALGTIFTTCGMLPASPKSLNGSSLVSRAARRVRALGLRLYGFHDAYLKWFDETLEVCTESAMLIECLHDRASQRPIEAAAFVPLPRRSRRIVHRFSGLELDDAPAECVVVASDLGAKLSDTCEDIDRLRSNVRRLLVCLNMSDAKARPALWRALRRRSVAPRLTLQSDGTRVAVLEMRPS